MKKQKYTILLLMRAMPSWLSLSRAERNHFFEETVAPILSRYSEVCHVRVFDSEYFHGVVSDFMVVETNDLEQYSFMIEAMRDTEIFSIPYFDLKDIIVGVENGFRLYEIEMNSGH